MRLMFEWSDPFPVDSRNFRTSVAGLGVLEELCSSPRMDLGVEGRLSGRIHGNTHSF